MDGSTSLSPEMVIRLANAKALAQTSIEGTISFIELSCYPMVSLFITTGACTSQDSIERELHLRYVRQPSTFPLFNLHELSPHHIGFEVYRSLLSSLNNDVVSFNEYRVKFDSVTDEINRAISRYHGLMCYEDGDCTNKMCSNIIILHICDVMNIMTSANNNSIPELYLKTSSLCTLDQRLCNQIELNFISSINTQFFLENIDYLYTCYAYFGNMSFVPIRTLVPLDSRTYRQASFYTNNSYYQQHQKGKLMEFNQNEKSDMAKVVYRST